MSFFFRKTAIVFGLTAFFFASGPTAGQEERNPRLVYEVGYNHMGEKYLKNGVAEMLPPGDTAKASENLEMAEEAFKTAIEANPAAVEPRINLARLYHLKQDFEQATAQYEEVLRLSPNNVNVLVDMALLKIETGHADEAAGYLEQAKRLTRDERTLRHLNRYVMNSGRSDRSEHSGIKQVNSRPSR